MISSDAVDGEIAELLSLIPGGMRNPETIRDPHSTKNPYLSKIKLPYPEKHYIPYL